MRFGIYRSSCSKGGEGNSVNGDGVRLNARILATVSRIRKNAHPSLAGLITVVVFPPSGRSAYFFDHHQPWRFSFVLIRSAFLGYFKEKTVYDEIKLELEGKGEGFRYSTKIIFT